MCLEAGDSNRQSLHTVKAPLLDSFNAEETSLMVHLPPDRRFMNSLSLDVLKTLKPADSLNDQKETHSLERINDFTAAPTVVSSQTRLKHMLDVMVEIMDKFQRYSNLLFKKVLSNRGSQCL